MDPPASSRFAGPSSPSAAISNRRQYVKPATSNPAPDINSSAASASASVLVPLSSDINVVGNDTRRSQPREQSVGLNATNTAISAASRHLDSGTSSLAGPATSQPSDLGRAYSPSRFNPGKRVKHDISEKNEVEGFDVNNSTGSVSRQVKREASYSERSSQELSRKHGKAVSGRCLDETESKEEGSKVQVSHPGGCVGPNS
jgi:hypothetical protein